jgi:glyoxylase-like metal-dependent hydrolase (beta-lactamase superfamily II)
MEEPVIQSCFEPKTFTWQYLVVDPATNTAVVIDPVLDYDAATNTISTQTADGLLEMIASKGYKIERLLETHAHADHLTAASYLQKKLEESQGFKPEICIGRRIGQVQERFAAKYGVDKTETEGVFDKLFDDDEVFKVGNLEAKAIHLPGHTPDHMGYMIGGMWQHLALRPQRCCICMS